MTGSGKTGLCLSLLEEAAIDGIGVIAIDPKGDLSNLALTFPELRADDFLPWIEEQEATREGRTRGDHAAHIANLWRQGLADTGQSAERIARLRAASEVAIFTPGSIGGRPLNVLGALHARTGSPMPADQRAERAGSIVQGLLALIGLDADPLQSREHIFLTSLLVHAWENGSGGDLGWLIHAVVTPPLQKIGVFDIDTFFPAKPRQELAMRLNNLLAAPSFAGWLQGEPLQVDRLLRNPAGKPRVSVLSISHLSETERMFFVTLLLGEVVAWMRAQPGTSSLRAILYMDEVFGFFPPVQEPPSKRPMLTLLKQARAMGLGVMMATQNPVDVDYKALSNCGSWWLGRLQTERDLNRVLEGLEGSASGSGKPLDTASMRTTLAGLQRREFVLHNVHDEGPITFRCRWALSYLRGPLTRPQVEALAHQVPPDPDATGAAGFSHEDQPEPIPPTLPMPAVQDGPTSAAQTGAVPPGIEQGFLMHSGASSPLRPMLLARVTLHYVHAKSETDAWVKPILVAPWIGPSTTWANATWYRQESLTITPQQPQGTVCAPLLEGLTTKQLALLQKELRTHLFQGEVLPLFYSPETKQWSRYGESEAMFIERMRLSQRERRDVQAEKIRSKFSVRHQKLTERLRKAQQKLEQQQAQRNEATLDSALNVGASVVGAIFGSPRRSSLTTAVRKAGKAKREGGEVKHAEQDVQTIQRELFELEAEVVQAINAMDASLSVPSIERKTVAPKKTDLDVQPLSVLWMP